VPFFRREGQESSQVFSRKADEKNSVRACQRCDLSRPNAALSPWRQVRKPLRPDERTCRKGTPLMLSNDLQFLTPNPLWCQLRCSNFDSQMGIVPLPKICYNNSSGLQTENMRTALRFLAILTIAALLAPGVRWASLRAPVEACACPPAACMCAGHHHALGHASMCGMAHGGQCGLESHDNYLSSVLNTLIYVPTEHPWANPLAPGILSHDTSDISLLSSHIRIPEQPPRATL